MKEFERLEVGQKYTMMKYNGFGFPVSLKFELIEVEIKPYAQYRESAVLTFKQKSKRKMGRMRILPSEKVIIWKGYQEIDTNIFENEKSNMTFQCFSNEYLNRATKSVSEKPLFETDDQNARV